MIGNPIIRKELVSVLRSGGARALAIVFVLALSLLALFVWPAGGVNPVGAAYSRLFLAIILFAQLIMLALFTPPFAATSISAERESNTWEMLYYSLLRPGQILFGKQVGAVAFLLVLVGLSLPVGGVCFLLGGVSVKTMALAYLVLAAAGVTFGFLGLTWSALLPSSFASLVVTYLSLLVLCGGVHVPMLLLPEWVEGQGVMHAVRCISPFTALAAITQDPYRAMGAGGAPAAVLARYFGSAAVLCAVMAVVVLVRVAMRPVPRIAARKRVVDEDMPRSVRMLRRVFFLIDSRRRRRSISLWMNPILVLDIRTRVAGLANLLRACFACLIFSLVLVILVSSTWGATQPDIIRLIALAFQIGLIGLIGPSLTIGAVASEVEGGTFDSLRMTPLRPWTVFLGKFGAAAALSMMLVVASAPVFFAILFIEGSFEGPRVAHFLTAMFMVTCVTIAFSLSVGFFFSVHCRTTARAAAWAYGAVAAVTVGTLLAAVLRERLSAGAAKFILAFNPIVTVVGAVSDVQFTEFGRWQHTVYALGTLSIVCVAATIYRLHRMAGPTS